jgi:hypothetical protein
MTRIEAKKSIVVKELCLVDIVKEKCVVSEMIEMK